MHRKIQCYKDIYELSTKAAVFIDNLSKEIIAEKNIFTMALSAGKTPKLLYEALAKRDTPWDKIHIFWVDERNVPHSHPHSNYLLIYNSFISDISIPEKNIHPVKVDQSSPETTAQYYEEELKRFFKSVDTLPVFDLILLGCGEDGHTASLFPGDKMIGTRKLWVRAINAPKIAPQVERVTITLGIINNATNIIFFVSGKNKAAAIKKVLEEKDSRLPAAMVKPKNGNLSFFFDAAATSQLSKLQY